MILVLFRCQGLGLQMGHSLHKISSMVTYEDLKEDIAYLLNDQGEILCTILRNKDEYESPNNQDRRLHNTRNGFGIVWEKNGDCCSIYNKNVKWENGNWLLNTWNGRVILLFVSGILVIVSFLIGYLLLGKSPKDSEGSTKPSLTKSESPIKVERTEDKAEYTSSELRDSLKTEIYDSIHYEAVRYSHQLKSINCTPHLVNEVSSWFEGLSAGEKKIANKVYRFPTGLHLFHTFFETKSMYEMHELLKYQSYFGKAQYEVIKNGFCRNSASFHELRGKDFHEAYNIYIKTMQKE